MDLVSDLTLVLVAALAGGFLAQRLRQPLIVGYLIAGVVVGPFTGGVTVRNPEDIERLAEIGVVLLLFSLGLEVSIRDLSPVRAVAIGGGLLQIALTIALGIGLASAFGWPRVTSLWFGASVALSSTMVALKTIQSQGRLGTLSSRVMLGILIVQDLAVVPLMVVLPAIHGGGGTLVPVLMAALRAVVVLGVILLAATRAVPKLLSIAARTNSRELFLLTTTAAAFGIALAAFELGLSLALGAFIAGIAINESEYAHQALADVMPLRDIFGMLFFVSVGMLLEPGAAWQYAGAIATTIGAVILVKAAVLGGIVAAFGYRRIVPLATGLTLFQVGEFAFVLARAGRSAGALPDAAYAVLLNTAVVTMALTPAISALAPRLHRLVRRRTADEPPVAVHLASRPLSGHVVIAGGGRVGQSTADALAALQLPFVIIEYNAHQFEALREAGLPTIYGDASRTSVLDAASVANARAVLVTVPAFPEVRAIVAAVRSIDPRAAIIARADGADAVRSLYALGVEDVTSPEFEASVAMASQALTRLGVDAAEILRVIDDVRRRRYRG